MTGQHTPLKVAFRRPWPGTVRGRSLWFLSLIIGLKGLGYLLGTAPASTDSALRLATSYVPLQLCGAIFVAVCLFSGFCAYCHFGRDRYGYAALGGLTLGWAGVYFVPAAVAVALDTLRWLSHWFGLELGLPDLSTNFYSALQGTLSYLLIFGLVRFLSRNVTLKDLLRSIESTE